MSEHAELISGLLADIAANAKAWQRVLDNDLPCWILMDRHDRAEHRAEYGMHLQIEWCRPDTLSRVVRYRIEPCARFYIQSSVREHLLPVRLHDYAERCLANCEKAIAHLNSLQKEAA